MRLDVKTALLAPLLLLHFAAVGINNFAAAQTGKTANSSEPKALKPVMVIKNNRLVDVSGDARLLLFYENKPPSRVLRVVKRDGWRETARQSITDSPGHPQFIPGGAQVFYQEGRPEPPFHQVSKLWNYSTSQTATCLDGSGGNFFHVLFLNDKRAVGTTSAQEKEKYLDLLTALQLPECRLRVLGDVYLPERRIGGRHKRITGEIAVSPDSKLLAYSLSDDKIIVRDAVQQNVLHDITALPLYSFSNLIFSSDNRFLITGAANKHTIGVEGNPAAKYYVLIFETETFKPVRQIAVPDAPRYALAVSPDSRLVAVAYRTRKKAFLSRREQAHVAVFDLATGAEVGRVSHPSLLDGYSRFDGAYISKIAFTPDGKYMLTSAYDTYVWDISGFR